MRMPKLPFWYTLLQSNIIQREWYTFANMYTKYRFADTTNAVEGLHSVRRKYADKRINFARSYELGANLAILATFLDNWMEIVMTDLGELVTPAIRQFFKVHL